MKPNQQAKPRKWRPKQDPELCIECEKPFAKGDLLYEDCAVCVHVVCVEKYGESLKSLGLLG